MEVSYSAMKGWAKATKETVMSTLARNRIRRVAILGVMILVWCSIFIPVITIHLTHQERDSNEENDPRIDALVWADFRGLNPISGDIKLALGTQSDGLHLNLGGETIYLESQIFPETNRTAYPIGNKDHAIYPFDEYEFTSFMSAVDVFNKTLNIDFILDIDGHGFTSNLKRKWKEAGVLNIEYTLKRHNTTKLLCFIIFALIWLLALVMINLAVDAVFYYRDTPPLFILSGFTVVFALPALRKIQPGIPDFGCILDSAGYFWGVTIVSFSACLMLYSWAFRWKPKCHRNYPQP
ncbi:hypothetical protein DSO57_1024658 [Entomophthora muscae]|uniref:Uncharacterized protein n=1 Tax=Entomophthora muscae TaxID=34485 RepID=A0ACC2UPJ4_9FUNG|nr:hypothetical protein DSO57_1024658 [Entomophthora muscae]